MANPEHYIYMIDDGEFVKIGFAINPKKRLQGLQTSNARKLEIIGCFRCPQWKKSTSHIVSAKNLERKIHKELKEFRVRGEWFRKTEKVLDAFDLYVMESIIVNETVD